MYAPLLHNSWIGKALGFTAAWIWAPTDPILFPSMLILGIVLGQGYDWWSTGQLIFDRKERSAAKELRHLYCDEPKVLTFLLAACGRVAKASGTVSVSQINYVEEIMESLHFDSKARTTGIGCFNQGKEQNFRFAGLAKVCLQQSNSTPQRQTIIRCLCHVAALQPSKSALTELQRLGAMIGFSPGRVHKEYETVFRLVNGFNANNQTSQSQQSQRQAKVPPEVALPRIG